MIPMFYTPLGSQRTLVTFLCPVGVLNFQKPLSPVSLIENPTPICPGKVLNVASNWGSFQVNSYHVLWSEVSPLKWSLKSHTSCPTLIGSLEGISPGRSRQTLIDKKSTGEHYYAQITIPSIEDSFHPKGLCGLVRRESQRDPCPLTTIQLSPAGPTQCLLPSCEVLGNWLIKSESQGQGRRLRWPAACTLLLAACLREVGQPGGEHLWAPPSLISNEAQLGIPSRKGWDLDLMENLLLLHQLPPDFLLWPGSCWYTWL